MLELRSYQREAANNIKREFSGGASSTLLVMATGTGKTHVFCSLAKEAFERTRKPVLVLAHRNELLQQAKNKLEDFGLRSAIEKADAYALSKSHNAVVASVQSLSQKKRLEMYPKDYFGFIVTDEAHHACSDSYRRIYKHFDSALHLGVTATPNRHDEIGLKNIFKSCAFQYSIQDGIKENYLCDVRGKQIRVKDLQLENLKIVAGEFSQTELDEMLRQETVLQGMVLPTIEYAENRPTIIFTTGVEHAHEIAACFNRIKKNSAVAVDGSMKADKREDALRFFEKGERQFLVNVGVCTEGYDHPPTACIALFRPTRSLGLLAQMIGRGTRVSEGKTDCLVLDFVGVNNTVRTMTVFDVLDGTILSEREHAKAQELQETGLGATDALRQSKTFIAALDAISAKMRALSTSSAFDVLQMFAIPSAKGLYGGAFATEKQVSFLKDNGIKAAEKMEKGEAISLIGEIINRREKGLATFKQLRYLKRLGYQSDSIEQTTFSDASRIINSLANKSNYAYA